MQVAIRDLDFDLVRRRVREAAEPARGTAYDQTVASLVRRGQDEGDFRPEVEPAAVAEVAVQSFIGIETVSELVTGRADLRRRAKNFRDLFLDAIRSPS